MKKKLLHNWTLKLASLILAFVLWFFIIQFEQPMETVSFSNVKVNLINTELLDNGNKYYEVLDDTDTIRVTVKAHRNITEKLSASDIVAVADVSNLTSINTIEIELDVPNEEVYSITSNREVVRLNVENRVSKWIRVNYNTTGQVADGYMVADVSQDQTLVEISGPASSVSQVSYAEVQISVEGASNSISANVDVELYNENGEILHLSNITKNVNYIHMDVEVLAVKEVPVELRTTGDVAEGYLLTGVTEASPDVIMLAGTPSALSGITKLTIPGELIDISGATETMVKYVNLKDYLPENIQFANSAYNGRVKVTIHVEEEKTKTLHISVNNIELRNVPGGRIAGYPAGVTECILTISGLEQDVDPWRYDNVFGYVDVAKWMQSQEMTELQPGTYMMPVTFELGEGVTVESDVNIQVDISDIL